MLKRLLTAKGIHYLVTRFAPPSLRSAAFDEKYRKGDWKFDGNPDLQLGAILKSYLKEGDLLMMGCGGASVLEGVPANNVNSVLGIDLSPEALRIASRYATNSIRFCVADMIAFTPDRSYDVILFSESIYYVPLSAQAPLLHRLSRNLKPSGVFVVTLAQAERFHRHTEIIRSRFDIVEDRAFGDSSRHLIVFHGKS